MNERTVIDYFLDPATWLNGFEWLLAWTRTHLLTEQTAVELGLIALTGVTAWLLANQVKQVFTKLSVRHLRYVFLLRLWKTLSALSFLLVWLILQYLVILITNYLEMRYATLVVSTSLMTAWIIIRVVASFVPNPVWSYVAAVFAWSFAALNILGVREQVAAILGETTIDIGAFSVSILTILEGLVTLVLLMWLSSVIVQIIDARLRRSHSLTPSATVLSVKLLHVGLITFTFLATLAIIGIDLTAFAVFGGAIGVGLGFGLQKIFSNLVSGFILLMDDSIKPGDVIAVADRFGRVDSLGARYVSVTTREGIEHLIPNEELITSRVENWSHSHNLLRLSKLIGVHYKSDVKAAIQLCLDAAHETARVLEKPEPACLLRDFGESSVDLELRFWIDDPMSGRANVSSEVLLRIWDKFHEHGIEIPYPQRDLHLRSSSLLG